MAAAMCVSAAAFGLPDCSFSATLLIFLFLVTSEMFRAISFVFFLTLSAGFTSAILVSAKIPQTSATTPFYGNQSGNGGAMIQLFCATSTSYWCDLNFTAPGRYYAYFVQQPTSGFGLIAQSSADGSDAFQAVFFGNNPNTHYLGCCSGVDCSFVQPVRWVMLDVSKCPPSSSGAYVVFDVLAAGHAIVVTNPNGPGPQQEHLQLV